MSIVKKIKLRNDNYFYLLLLAKLLILLILSFTLTKRLNSQEILASSISTIDGITYSRDTKEPISGTVLSHWDNGQIYNKEIYLVKKCCFFVNLYRFSKRSLNKKD